MVGREADLRRVLSVLDTVAQGHGRLVLLAGEAGVGKTRLAREVLVRARAAGVQSLVGRCFEQHSGAGFFPFTEAFGAAFAEAPTGFQADVRSRWPELRSVVPDFGSPGEANREVTQLHVFRAAAGFLQALADANPVVLLLDDLHWADSTSLILLLYLARHIDDTCVMILGTYRDTEVGRRHPIQATLREVIRERLVEEVDLRRLDIAGTMALIQMRLATESVSDQLAALVHERAQGNPFLTEELLAAFVEQGVVTPGAHGPQLAALGKFKLPRSIRSVVGGRVGRLPAEAQEMLSLASFLGPEFDLEVLVAAGGRSEAAVLNNLDAAIEARLLQECRQGHQERYGFVHALVQEVLYEELPAHRRRRLHLRIGEVVEKLRAEPATAAAELARHFLQGGDIERATAYGILAGDHAAGRYAHSEAAQQYEAVLDHLRERGEARSLAEVQRRLAGELYDLNCLPKAVAAYEAALAMFENLGDDAGQALVHWGLGRLHDSRYDMVAAVRHLDEAVRLWPTQRKDADLARLLADSARAKTFSGDSDAALQLAERGLALAEQLGDASLLARALLGLAIGHDQDKDRPMIPLLDRAEGLARTAGDWRTLARIYGHRGSRYFSIGELEQALEDRRRAIGACEQSGEIHRLVLAYTALALDCLQVGRWDEGRAAARAGLALDPHGSLNLESVRVNLAWMEGRYEDALSQIRALLADARQRHNLQDVTILLWQIADFSLQLDRPAEAEAPAREAAEVARTSWRSEVGDCLATLSETLALLGARDAEAVLGDAEHLLELLEKAVGLPQLLRAKGRLLLRRGDVTGAIAALDESASAARSQHAHIQLGRTLSLLAEAARLRGDVDLAKESDAERAAIVKRIGPEVRGLAWTQRVPRNGQRGRVRSLDSEQVGPLSPREREVAGLIAQGLTDRQIADRLVITEGTAGVHVGHILNKLGFHARTEIASWAAQRGLGGASDAPC
jgi:DNA-binding CsgD family transcriptional regulator/tetratricopeptide (TPR) repeat protein